MIYLDCLFLYLLLFISSHLSNNSHLNYLSLLFYLFSLILLSSLLFLFIDNIIRLSNLSIHSLGILFSKTILLLIMLIKHLFSFNPLSLIFLYLIGISVKLYRIFHIKHKECFKLIIVISLNKIMLKVFFQLTCLPILLNKNAGLINHYSFLLSFPK